MDWCIFIAKISHNNLLTNKRKNTQFLFMLNIDFDEVFKGKKRNKLSNEVIKQKQKQNNKSEKEWKQYKQLISMWKSEWFECLELYVDKNIFIDFCCNCALSLSVLPSLCLSLSSIVIAILPHFVQHIRYVSITDMCIKWTMK